MGIQSWIQLLQTNHGPLVASAADQRMGTCLHAGGMRPEPQAIALKGELQTSPRLKPHQLAQPDWNPQQPLEESVHSTPANKDFVRLSQLAVSAVLASFAQVILRNRVAPPGCPPATPPLR